MTTFPKGSFRVENLRSFVPGDILISAGSLDSNTQHRFLVLAPFEIHTSSLSKTGTRIRVLELDEFELAQSEVTEAECELVRFFYHTEVRDVKMHSRHCLYRVPRYR